MQQKTNNIKVNVNQFFDQQYYRRYKADFTSTKRYQNNKELYDKKIKESNWFFGFNKGERKNADILAYMNRPDSDTDKTPIEYYKALEKAGSDDEETRSTLGYIKNRHGSIGFFDADGSIDEKKAREITKFMQTIPQIGWSNVLSPSSDISEKCLTTAYDAQRLLKTIIPEQLRIQNLDPDKFYWFGAFHRNTEHPHIHYVIVPKTNQMYRAYCPKDLTKQMHKFVNNYLNPDNLPFPIKRKEFFDLLDVSSKSNKTNRKLEQIVINKKQYARLTKEERKIVNSYTWQAINKNITLKKAILDVKKWGEDKQAQIIATKQKRHEEISDKDKNYAKTSYFAFMNRVYNHAMGELEKEIQDGTIFIRNNQISFNDPNKTKKKELSSPNKSSNKARNKKELISKDIERRRKRREMRALFRRSASAIIAASFDLSNSMAKYLREYEREVEELEELREEAELELKYNNLS